MVDLLGKEQGPGRCEISISRAARPSCGQSHVGIVVVPLLSLWRFPCCHCGGSPVVIVVVPLLSLWWSLVVVVGVSCSWIFCPGETYRASHHYSHTAEYLTTSTSRFNSNIPMALVRGRLRADQ